MNNPREYPYCFFNYEKYNPQDITITGSGIEKTPDSDREYIVKIASIQAQTYSFQIEASNNFAGWININLEGTDGYSITSTQEVSIIIPMQYSEEDIAVFVVQLGRRIEGDRLSGSVDLECDVGFLNDLVALHQVRHIEAEPQVAGSGVDTS